MESKPQAGQWWFANTIKPGQTAKEAGVFIVGQRPDGKVVYDDGKGLFTDVLGWSEWHHEPLCTGWDWLPTKPQPAEDPDEWVVQDRVPARPGVDDFKWSCWQGYYFHVVHDDNIACGMMHGEEHEGSTLSVRCRRKDLPKSAPQAPVKPSLDELIEQVKRLLRFDVDQHAKVCNADEDNVTLVVSHMHYNGYRDEIRELYRLIDGKNCKDVPEPAGPLEIEKDLPKPRRTITVPKWLVIYSDGDIEIFNRTWTPVGQEVHRVGETTYTEQEDGSWTAS